ncbi:DUF1566 domain-containing protein [Thiothrix winogradskyi]|uniref:DUF1566 domain-containing protein n=1 Tax=Thiothrix winogradskyi TaxID=96472 RepID=A0ABY3T4S4_9GAMM|nr:DUF1566 domain-containing protein [Thiothrix winogradskyi]UJS25751.1 DUF1566 domain-containing protein [Thiothrix winogradskyi]
MSDFMSKVAVPFLLSVLPICGNAQICQVENILSTTPDSQFIDNNNGTVTDINSELMWKKCTEGQHGDDCNSGVAQTYKWEVAQEQIDIANRVSFAGYTNWRLPNIKELSSIVERQCYEPAINLRRFPNTPSALFLSSSPFDFEGNNAWGLYFPSGSASWFQYTFHEGYMRLVRDDATVTITKVDSVGPSILVRNLPTEVSVTGYLPVGTVFAIENVVCNGDYSQVGSGWVSVSQTCTAQPGTPSTVHVVVKDAEGGNVLPNGNISLEVADSAVYGTGVYDSSDGSLTKNVPAKVEIHGGNLPATVVFAIADVVCKGDYSRTSTTVSQTCTAQPGTPSTVRLVVKDAPNGNIIPSGDVFSFSVK